MPADEAGAGRAAFARATLPHLDAAYNLARWLVLRELEEMSYRDIARVTGVPTGTVMSRLWRARQALLRHGQQAAPARPATKEALR